MLLCNWYWLQCMTQILWGKMWFNKRKDNLRQVFFSGKRTIAWFFQPCFKDKICGTWYKIMCVVCFDLKRFEKIVNPIKSSKWHLATQFFHFEILMCEYFTIRIFVKTYLPLPSEKEIYNSVYSSRLVIRPQI